MSDGGPVGGQPAETVKKPGRASEALIYVPGLSLGLLGGEKTKRGVVKRLARALNQQADRRSLTYSVRWNDGAVDDGDGGWDVATISRKDEDEERPVLDCYAYVWSGGLNKNWEAQNRFKRLGRLLMTLLSAPSFIRFFGTSGKKNPWGRWQLGFAYLLVILVAIYFGILLWALVQTGLQLKDKYLDDAPTAASAQSANAATASKTGDDGATTPQWIALICTAVGAAMPGMRRTVIQIGTGMAASASYVRVGEGRSEIIGGLDELVESVAENPDYERITILAYSFGSIITIDALFPDTGAPPRSFDKVSQLVTIASPYDFVRALRPSWGNTDKRSVRPGVPQRWLNIYSRIDLMGSNYRTEAEGTEATVAVAKDTDSTAVRPTDNVPWEIGIEPKFTNLGEFYGFSSHGMYWGLDNREERNVFLTVVEHVYAGTPILT